MHLKDVPSHRMYPGPSDPLDERIDDCRHLGRAKLKALITGMTIGYGDLVPQQPLTRVLAVAIGFFGIALTGIVAALAVRALQATADAQNAEKMAAHDIQ